MRGGAFDGDALRLKFGDLGTLQCPHGCETAHLESVEVYQGKRLTTVTGVGVSDGPAPEGARYTAPFCRGSVVRILFWCEEGHEFDVVLEFHKGATAIAYGARDVAHDRDSLWRD